MPQTPQDAPQQNRPTPAATPPHDPRAHEDAAKSAEPPPWRGVPGTTGPADGADPAAAGED